MRAVRHQTIRALIGVVVVGALALLGAGFGQASPPAIRVAAMGAPGDEASWGVRPSTNENGVVRAYFDHVASTGQRIDDAMDVVNHGAQPLTLRVYASDAFTTAGGGIDLLPAVESPVDLGAWITVGTDSVTIAPGETVTVPFTITVPQDATPGDHTAGIVTSLTTAQSGSTVAVDRRLGSRVYLRVAGNLEPSLRITDVSTVQQGSLNPFGGGSVELTYTVGNTGNVRLSANEIASVSGIFGLITADSPTGEVPVLLPGNSLTRTVTVDGVPPLTVMSAQIDLEPQDPSGAVDFQMALASGSTAVWIWPWPQIILLLLIGGAVGLWLLNRKRRSRNVQSSIDRAVAEALSGQRADSSGTVTGPADR